MAVSWKHTVKVSLESFWHKQHKSQCSCNMYTMFAYTTSSLYVLSVKMAIGGTEISSNWSQNNSMLGDVGRWKDGGIYFPGATDHSRKLQYSQIMHVIMSKLWEKEGGNLMRIRWNNNFVSQVDQRGSFKIRSSKCNQTNLSHTKLTKCIPRIFRHPWMLDSVLNIHFLHSRKCKCSSCNHKVEPLQVLKAQVVDDFCFVVKGFSLSPPFSGKVSRHNQTKQRIT